MRLRLCVLVLSAACGGPHPTSSAPNTPEPPPPAPTAAASSPADAAVDATVVDAEVFVAADALVCKYRTCIDICCDKDEVCAHGRLGDQTIPKCLRPHH